MYISPKTIKAHEARIRELEAVLRGIYPAAREILWCALVWNDHNFDWKTLLQHADLAAKQLGFDRLSGDPITAANKWMARITHQSSVEQPK